MKVKSPTTKHVKQADSIIIVCECLGAAFQHEAETVIIGASATSNDPNFVYMHKAASHTLNKYTKKIR